MDKNQKNVAMIAGALALAVIVVWFLTRKQAPATVIQEDSGGMSFNIPEVAPIVLNGGDPRLVYTPGSTSGDAEFTLPGWNMPHIPSRETNTLPPNNSPNNWDNTGGNCCCGGDAYTIVDEPRPMAWTRG